MSEATNGWVFHISRLGMRAQRGGWDKWYFWMNGVPIKEQFRDDPEVLSVELHRVAALMGVYGGDRDEGIKVPKETMAEVFERYHIAHPEVFAGLAMLAERALREGREEIRIGHLWEGLRANFVCRFSGKKLTVGGNDFKTFYSRVLQACLPGLRGKLTTKKMPKHGEYVPSEEMVELSRYLTQCMDLLVTKITEKS